MKRTALALTFILALLVSTMVVVTTVHFGMAQSGTNVTGMITSNAIWTQANSPYTLTGNLTVKAGVTLTVEPGVTVNLNDSTLQVGGTLVAIGTPQSPVIFDAGDIIFSPSSAGYNLQTETGSVIENAQVAAQIMINNASPLIAKSFLNTTVTTGTFVWWNGNHLGYACSISINGGSPLIINNTLTNLHGNEISISGDSSALIFNNKILPNNTPCPNIPNTNSTYCSMSVWVSGEPVISDNIIPDGIWIDGSPIISNNTIGGSDFATYVPNTSGIVQGSPNMGILIDGGSPIISGNFLTSHIVLGLPYTWNSIYGEGCGPINASISDNTLSGGAIQVFNGQATIQRNYVSGNVAVYPSVANFDGSIPCGIDVNGYNALWNVTALIQNNTISDNSIGMHIEDAQPPTTIIGNNIENNSEISISSTALGAEKNAPALTSSGNVTASNNWFGTTDMQAISQSLNGTINVTPILTEPNPDAMPNPALVENPINASVQDIASSVDPSSSTVFATANGASTVAFTLQGNVTSQQLSNVTVTANSAANETQISFTLTGENGAVGFCNMTIPVCDVPYGTTPNVLIDNQTAQNQGYTCDGNNYYVWYTTHFSTHQISIMFTSPNSTPTPSPTLTVPEFPAQPLIITIVACMTVILSVVLIAKKNSHFSTKEQVGVLCT